MERTKRVTKQNFWFIAIIAFAIALGVVLVL